MNDKTKIIKEEIKKQYGSIRKFCEIVDIPSTTLTSALSNNIGNMGFDKVVKICTVLNLDIMTFQNKKEISKENNILNVTKNEMSKEEIKENIINKLNKLNELGHQKALERIEEMTQIPRYQIGLENTESEKIKSLILKEEPKNEEEFIKIVARGKGVTTISKEEFEKIEKTAIEVDNIDDYF